MNLLNYEHLPTISVPIFAISGALNEENGSRLFELNLTVLFPRINLLWKNTVTSGMVKVPAIIREPMKLSLPSLRDSNKGIWKLIRMKLFCQSTGDQPWKWYDNSYYEVSIFYYIKKIFPIYLWPSYNYWFSKILEHEWQCWRSIR